MRNTLLIAFCFLIFGTTFGQEKELSKEEKERREKNIQAGNPFAEFGYKAKVATLSKGKYLEVHDLDSIVKIGSSLWHVRKQKIVGNVKQDSTDMYRQPLFETAGRWLSPDPLAEEFPEWNPYHYVHNNPINMIDPTGLAAEWVPTVKEDGSTAYIAEAGDSAETMSSQYGISQSNAEAITGTTGNTEIAAGTEISGESVKNVTGSDVLKLDLNSKLATDQRVFDQYLFASDHSKSQGNFGFYTTEYYGNVFNQANRLAEGFAKLNVDGQNFNVNYQIPLYDTQGVMFNVKSHAYFLNNSTITSYIRNGNMFGTQGDISHQFLPLYLSFGKGTSNLKRQGEYRISTPSQYGNKLNNRLNNKK